MFTSGGTYPQLSAYPWGFDAGPNGGLLVGFKVWVMKRVGHALHREVVPSAMTAEENKVAIASLLALLDEYLALGDADPRAAAAFGPTKDQP